MPYIMPVSSPMLVFAYNTVMAAQNALRGTIARRGYPRTSGVLIESAVHDSGSSGRFSFPGDLQRAKRRNSHPREAQGHIPRPGFAPVAPCNARYRTDVNSARAPDEGPQNLQDIEGTSADCWAASLATEVIIR